MKTRRIRALTAAQYPNRYPQPLTPAVATVQASFEVVTNRCRAGRVAELASVFDSIWRMRSRGDTELASDLPRGCGTVRRRGRTGGGITCCSRGFQLRAAGRPDLDLGRSARRTTAVRFALGSRRVAEVAVVLSPPGSPATRGSCAMRWISRTRSGVRSTLSAILRPSARARAPAASDAGSAALFHRFDHVHRDPMVRADPRSPG